MAGDVGGSGLELATQLANLLQQNECGMNRHTKDQCFKIIGYPDWWTGGHKTASNKGAKIDKPSNSPTTNTRNSTKNSNDRRSKGGFRGVAAAVGEEGEESFSIKGKRERGLNSKSPISFHLYTSKNRDSPFICKTDHQQQYLNGSAYMAQTHFKNSNGPWIFDCGATDTMSISGRDELLGVALKEMDYTMLMRISGRDELLGVALKEMDYTMLMRWFKVMKLFFQSKGIVHQTTCPHTPEQNGVAERKNRLLLEMTRALIIESHVPKSFWPEALATATYLINRLPTKILKMETPLETLSEYIIIPQPLTLQPKDMSGLGEEKGDPLSWLSYTAAATIGNEIQNHSTTSAEAPNISATLEHPVPDLISERSSTKTILSKKTTRGAKYLMANIAEGNLSNNAKAFAASLHSEEIPSSFEQALKLEKWKNAMDDEMKALKKNKT
nr:putative ribonuclease H-like domain-containing protein [Tanacetum cinerariifolium]